MWRLFVSSRAFGILLATSLLLLTPLPVRGQPTEAQAIVERARAAFDAEEYVEAAALFAQAFELDPHPVLLYNQARCYQELGDLLGALDLFYAALELNPNERVIEQIDTQISAIESIIISHGFDLGTLPPETFVDLSTLTITSLPDGANVIIEGDRIGVTPIESLYVAPGSYEIQVTMAGYQTYRRTAHIEPGQILTMHAGLRLESGTTDYAPSEPGLLEIVGPRQGMEVFLDDDLLGRTPLAPIPIAPGQYTITVRHPAYEPWQTEIEVMSGDSSRLYVNATMVAGMEETGWTTRDWGFATLAGGGALLVTGVVFGVLAQAEADRYHTNTTVAGRDAIRDTALTEAVIADVFYAGSIAAIGTAAVLLFVLDSGGQADDWDDLSWRAPNLQLTPQADGWAFTIGRAF